MPNAVSESDLIEAAYEDEVKLLYKTLVGGLSASGSNPSPGEEQQCLQRFKAGLILARRARELALSAVAPALSTRMTASAQSAVSPRGRKTRSSAGAEATSPAPSGKPRTRRR